MMGNLATDNWGLSAPLLADTQGTRFNNEFRNLTTSALINSLDGWRLCVPSGFLEYDSGVVLAPSRSSYNCKWSCGKKSASNLVQIIIGELRDSFEGSVFKPKVYIKIVDGLLANVLYAEHLHRQLLVSRNRSKVSDAFIRVCDFLLSSGYVVGVKGKQNEYNGAQSWIVPSTKLLNMAKRENIKVQLADGVPMLEIRDAKKKPIKLSSFKKTEVQRAIQRHSKGVQAYNEMMLRHDVNHIDGRTLLCFSHRVFNLSLSLGGRFYGGCHLSIKSHERAGILIDGEPTIELDLKALHPCMLYAMGGIQLDPIKDDPYSINGIDRKAVKLAMLILVNIRRPQDAKAAITFSGKAENIAKYEAYKEARESYEKARHEHIANILKGKQSKVPTEPTRPFKIYDKTESDQGKIEWKPRGEMLFIPGIPEGTNGTEVVKAIMKKHAPISHYFGSENLGLKLQNLDSDVMNRVLMASSAFDIPALPVHDSVVIRESDRDTVINVFKTAYRTVMKADCRITQKTEKGIEHYW